MTHKKSWQRPLSVTQEHFDSEYDRIFKKPKDALAGNGDTFEEKVSLSDEMRLHQEKHKPEQQ
jgi:hypothetical protein